MKRDPVKQLPALKVKLVTAKNFLDVFNYFFDHFGENEDFMGLGEPKPHPLLEEVLVHTARQVIQSPVIIVRNAFFIHLPEQHFIHGACLFNAHLANFFYFEDIDTGMLALAPSPLGKETQIARFSCQQLGKPRKPANN